MRCLTPHSLSAPETSQAGASAVVSQQEAPQVSTPSPAPQADTAPTAEDPLTHARRTA